jgi:hypothetical protein
VPYSRSSSRRLSPREVCSVSIEGENCKKPPQLRLGLQKTTRLPVFCKDHYFYSTSFAKSTDRALDAG